MRTQPDFLESIRALDEAIAHLVNGSNHHRNGSRRRASRRPQVPMVRGERLQLARPEDAPDPEDPASVRKWLTSSTAPTVVDLFCGAGGLSLGLQLAGFRVVVGADADDHAVETHTANLGGLGYVGDLSDHRRFLRTLDRWGIDRVDVVAAGLPCQPFSRAGRAKIRSLVAAGTRPSDDPRTRMWRSFSKIVRRLRPRAVLLENVPDLAAHDEGGVIIRLCEALRGMGYVPAARLLHAYEHGVPQHRSRLFIVALAPGVSFQWPKPSRRKVLLKDAIGDLPWVQPGRRVDSVRYEGASTSFQKQMRQGMRGENARLVFDHMPRAVRPDDAEAFDLMRQGDTYLDLPDHLKRYSDAHFRDKYKRLEWSGLSRSITAHIAKDGYWYIHPRQNRTLSIREAARIQTFPDRFRFAGQPTHRYVQIGNAVPPLLAQAIGERVLCALASGSSAPTVETDRRAALLAWHRDHAREYPWRGERNAWRVLLAEMCLRRTRADQVVPVYRKLLRLAPSPAKLLENAAEVRRAMASLGLRWRAKNLLDLARVLVDEHAGKVPLDELELRDLPGVGQYVAGAVRTFGRGERAVLLDTNTSRIVGRTFGRKRLSRWQLRLDLYDLAGRRGPDAEFNYALLDLGALVCRPTAPRCDECPLQKHCAFAQGRAKRAALRNGHAHNGTAG